MIRLGLTGSIGMGKTTTAALFAEEGVPVFDADAAVHALYDAGAAAVPLLQQAFPGVAPDGRVDREALAREVIGKPEALARLEAIVHPLVGLVRADFLRTAQHSGAAVVVLDVPLLFETGRRGEVDAVVVASAPSGLQRERVLARPGMTPERYEALLARQAPDAEKRRFADFVVDTGSGLEPARQEVRRILAAVTKPGWKPRAHLDEPRERTH